MEVKPGYKQTEVGIIPKEWEVKCLGEMATIATGNTPPTNDASNYGDEFPFVGPVDLGESKYIAKTEKMLSRKGFMKSRRFPGGSILFVSIGSTIGKCGVAPVELTSNQQINAIFPSASFSEDYLYYAVCAVAPKIKEQAGEQAVPIVNKSQFSVTPISIPPLAEQRAIATTLSDVDELLGGLDQLIAKKRDLKQATMQQLLTGQARLPGFTGEWKHIKLRQFVTRDRFAIVDGPFGTQLTVDEYVESGVPVIEMEHLNDGVITDGLLRCVTPRKFSELKRSAVYPGDILISKTGSLGKLGIMPDNVERGLITSRLAKVTLDPALADRRFVFQFLLILRQGGYWEHVSQGGTMQILGIGMLQNAPVPDLSLREQTAIAEVLADMDAELAALEQRRAKTRALKQAMMQELLTGRIRLI